MMRLAIVASHPIQYQAPLFRHLARRVGLHVFFAHRATPEEQAGAGFGVPFDWDVDLTSGYAHSFLHNVARRPGTDRFSGCDTPDAGRRIGEGRFDAVLVMGWHLKSFLQAALAAKARRIPLLVRGDSQLLTPRTALKRAAKACLYPPFLRLFDAALYVGERSRAYYEHYRYPAARLFFSPHCVDTAWFAARATAEAARALRTRLEIAPEARVVLFAGKLLPFKRPLDTVEACALLRRHGLPVEMMVAGSGPLESEMSARARTLGLPLHGLGFQNQTQMPAAYAAADMLVLPSSQETWGLVANEALACGRPVVVSDACGCAPDLAGDGSAGRVFPAGDVPALSRAIESLLGEPPAAEAIRRRSERFSLDAAAQGILEAAAYAAGGRRP